MPKTSIWTREKCHKEAEKYRSRGEFQRECNKAYKAAYRKGWLEEYTWLKRPEVYNKKWSYDTCREEALKYTSISAFKENSGKAYYLSLKNKWIEDFNWLDRKKKTNGFWTREECYNEAKKYKTRTEFRKGSGSCYAKSRENGWLDDYVWMPKRKKIQSKWTREKCFEIARKYKTKKDYRKNDNACYNASLKNKWIKEMDCFEPASIEPFENLKTKHLVYVYKDDELNVAYVGLTSNLPNRHRRHLKSGTVFTFFSEQRKDIPTPLILKDGLTPKESRYYEDFFRKDYSDKGYQMLNKGTTGTFSGSLGGGRVVYTKEKSNELARKYKTLKDFYTNEPSCYNRARMKGWLEDYKWLNKVRC